MIAELVTCMAMNIYHEARNEPTVGQLAVAQVVMNRVHDPRFPDNVCDIIHQGPVNKDGMPIKYKCQFSWYCDGLSDKPKNKKAYQRAQENAITVLNGWTGTFFDGATHYHADYVTPHWVWEKTFIMKINSHIFYRWD